LSQLGFEPVFDSYLAAALLAGLLLLFALAIKPQFGSLTPRRRRVLTALRLAAVLLAAAALLRPTWITTVRTQRQSILLVLLDMSRSMTLASGRSEQSRWQAQVTALVNSHDELARLAGKNDVKIYAYDSRLKPLEFSAGKIHFPDAAKGEQTDIGTSLNEALQAAQGKQLASVVLLGDGAQTAFEPQVETQQAARKLRDDFAAPLYTVTFGLAGDAAQARDIAIDRFDEQFTVFVKNELLVRGMVRVRGYVNQDLPVDLVLTDEKGQSKTIGHRTIRANEDNRQVEVEFTYTPQEPGHYRLALKAPPQPDEQVTKNNQLDAFLTVLEGGLRVLYLYGNLPFEQKALRRAINASPDIELDDQFIDSRDRRKWPVKIGPLITSGKYDAFILGDIDAFAFSPEDLSLLADAVSKQGKGLLMLGGVSSFGRGHYYGTKIAEALPIVIDPLENADFQEAQLDRFFLPGPLTMVPTGRHPITRLAADGDSAAIWGKLPPLAWANKFAGIKQAPGTRVLLQTPQGAPLLVSGEYGAGRTLAFAGESTFRWAMHGYGRELNRFWRQVILWLVRRDDFNRDDVWIKLDQRRLNPGSKVAVRAGAKTAAGDPLADARFETVLIRPGGKQEPLVLSRDEDEFRATLQPAEPGDYAIETTAYEGDRLVGKARAEFMVFDRDVELSTPAADPDLMASLAAWTKQDGGRAVAPEELPKLLAEIAKRPPEYEVRQTRWKLAGTSGDAWLMLVLMTSVLSVEWYLRKRWGLV
jgi:uncharacterized membrane protein